MGKIFDALQKSSTPSKVVSVIGREDSRGQDSDSVITKDRGGQDRDTDFTAINRSIASDCHFNENLVTALKPQSFEAEQFKLLKTNILFPAEGQPPKVIMITSAVPGEGKSFVAANLAISIAQNIDEHVLLMDCDLRLPTIHKLFGIDGAKGLSDVLRKDTPVSSLLRKTSVQKLTILPGGMPPNNPAELLSSEKMSQLITEMRDRYDDRYIIVDSAPPQLTSESGALSKKVDGILLVVNHGSTKRETVKELIDIVGRSKILGVVLNRFDTVVSSYYGYGKYGKMSRYYKEK